MGDVTTLVIGPSGTGKELVARSIGLARYIPFDPAGGCFAESFAESFHAVNLSALSPTLIESELFGHRKGSFTGAVVDRQGWFEVCPPLGTVFLDEIGELDPTIQVKLLRVLQSRGFQRMGETSDREFHGKIIAATNRDLAAAMRGGQFREDFYYRLCADVIHTPSLREQLAEAPDDLPAILDALAAAPHVKAEGLMTMAPYSDDPDDSRPYFAQLRVIMERIPALEHFTPRHLSMGMSGDFEVAIEEGATMIRVGTAIFGPRSE